MSKTEEKEVEKWVTVKGKHVPIYKDDKTKKKETNNPAWDKAVAKITDAKEVWHIDREGFAVGITKAGDIFVGHGGLDNYYYKDTPENRKKAETYWQSSSFAREIKKNKR